jgi:hypothetical protein
MAIGHLDQQAFRSSVEFNSAVDSVWLQEILAKLTTLQAEDTPDEAQVDSMTLLRDQLLGNRNIDTVIQVMVADAGWTLTYSAWAADQKAAAGAILAGVSKYMTATG